MTAKATRVSRTRLLRSVQPQTRRAHIMTTGPYRHSPDR
jgi:hypothetical protein